MFQSGLELLDVYEGLPSDLAEKRAAYHDQSVWETHKGIKASGDRFFLNSAAWLVVQSDLFPELRCLGLWW